MTDKISILITGNPDSSSGFSNIGSVGSGLEKFDPDWPGLAKGEFVLTISETDRATRYCLIYNSALITAEGSNRSGMLNFQLLIPFDEVIVGSDGKYVSPFLFLRRLFGRFEKLHLKTYPGVEGWNFTRNARMTEEEFADFLKDYRLVHAPLPQRRLDGKGEATLVLPPDKIEQLALDHAYPQLTEFNRLVLCTEGTTSPASLAGLEIPRLAEYEVYVNNQKMNVIFRKGDQPFGYTVVPQDTYKIPETITVNLEEGENKKVDFVNERIDYKVSFKDKTEERSVTVALKGCEGNTGLYDRLMKQLLKGIGLKDVATGLPCRRSNVSIPAKTVIFTLKGAEIGAFWSPECTDLPKNVIMEELEPVSDKCWRMRFLYEKPVEKPKTAVVREPDVELKPQSDTASKNADKRKQEGQDKGKEAQKGVSTAALPVMAVVPVYIAAYEPADSKLTGECRNLTFDMEVHGDPQHPVLAYQDLKSKGTLQEKRLSSKGESGKGCFATEIHLPSIYLQYMKENGRRCIEVESGDDRYILKAQYGKLDDEPQGEWFIRVLVRRRSLGKRLLAAPWLKLLLIALVCLGIGWWIGESFTPWHKLTARQSAEQPVVDPAAGENVPVDSSGGEDSTGGAVDPAQPDEEVAPTPEENPDATRDAVTGDNAGATGADKAADNAADKAAALTALNREAADYLEMIRKASVSFAQLSEIQRWVMANKSYSGKINNYSEIMKAVTVFTSAGNLVSQIKRNADFAALAPRVNTFVKGIPTDAPYKQLRMKMQKLNGGNGKSNEEVAEILYEFAEKHPAGITSFSQL